jgi:cobyrinic acid a,c-diamide synthase
MYLGRAITTLDGTRHPLAGVLPMETIMRDRLAALGYSEVTWTADSLWGTAGQVARGHEFHYSQMLADDEPSGGPSSGPSGWQPAYTVCRRRAEPTREGFSRGQILAGYVHLHWASRPEAIHHFLSRCEQAT